jgi:hypothetical protein
MSPRKNLFFPLSPEEEEDIEQQEEQEENEDGYAPLTNDYYDLPGGQYYIFFEKNRKYREETE